MYWLGSVFFSVLSVYLPFKYEEWTEPREKEEEQKHFSQS